ncbi:hypothetical protein [Helicobacter sp. T3_23-1056]
MSYWGFVRNRSISSLRATTLPLSLRANAVSAAIYNSTTSVIARI